MIYHSQEKKNFLKYFLGNVSTFAHERTPVRAIMLTCKHFISGDQIQVIGRWAHRGFIITPTTTRIIASEICGPWINYTRLSMGAFITAEASRPIHAPDEGSRARLGFLQKMWKLNESQARPRRTKKEGKDEDPTTTHGDLRMPASTLAACFKHYSCRIASSGKLPSANYRRGLERRSILPLSSLLRLRLKSRGSFTVIDIGMFG